MSKDNREIVHGVQFYEDGDVVTFDGTGEDDADEIEARITPERLEQLLEAGSLKGDWKAHGKGTAEPMPGSAHHRALVSGGPEAVKALEAAQARKAKKAAPKGEEPRGAHKGK